MNSISTLMYMVWHVDKYKITFKLDISHWTNEMSFSTHSRILFSSEYFHYKIFIHEKCLENWNDNSQENLSQPGIIDARAWYRVAAWRLRNTALEGSHGLNSRPQNEYMILDALVVSCWRLQVLKRWVPSRLENSPSYIYIFYWYC